MANLSVPDYRKKSTKQRLFGSLVSSLYAFAFIIFSVFVINVSVFIWAQKRFGISSGNVTLQRDKCSTAKRLHLWLHLVINVLSTLVFMGSNTFIQAFISPTRREIDAAHCRRRWLHIGVLSFRNLRGIAKRRAFICLLLALTSTPVHLL